MTPGDAQRRGRSSSLLPGVVVVGVTFLASCAGGRRFELTLRFRGFDGVAFATANRCPQADTTCPASFSESSWVAADGRTATAPAHTVVFRADGSPDKRPSQKFDDQYYYDDVACGGQEYKQRYYRKSPPKTGPNGAFEVEIDDGNRLTIDPTTAVSVETGRYTLCFEEVGTWRGTAGDLRNHTGTFNLHYDSIQTVLRLVEN